MTRWHQRYSSSIRCSSINDNVQLNKVIIINRVIHASICDNQLRNLGFNSRVGLKVLFFFNKKF